MRVSRVVKLKADATFAKLGSLKDTKIQLSKINPELIAAYKASRFCIFSEPPVTMKVNSASVELKTLMVKHNASSAALITAFNPYSQILSDDDNHCRNRLLLADIQQGGYAFYFGLGQDVDAEWPGEQSYFVLDIERHHAAALGVKYQQNAIVWCSTSSAPELVLLR